MKLGIAAALSSVMLAAAPAQAVIVSITLTGGSVFPGATGQVIAAPSAVPTATSNNVVGFNERQGVLLGAVANTRPQAFLFATSANGVIPQGVVSSHIISFNPGSNQTVTGTVTFNQYVLGVQRTGGQINATRSNQLETGATDFTGVNALENADVVTLLGPKAISFSLSAGGAGSDVFRVITAVPEASTWAMMLAGFGLVGFGMRRRRAVVAA